MSAFAASRPLFPLPLRWVIFLCLAGLLTVASLAIGFSSFFALRHMAEDVLVEDLQDAAKDVANQIQSSLLERRREIEMLSAAQEIRSAESDPGRLRILLRRAQEISPRYALIGFATGQGILTITSNGLAEGAKVSDRQYWQMGKIGVYVGDAHDAILLATSLGSADKVARFIDIAAPVREDGKFLGVIVAHLSTEWAEDVGNSIMQRLFARYPRIKLEVRGADDVVIFIRMNFAQAPITSGTAITRSATVDGIGTEGTLSWPVQVTLPSFTPPAPEIADIRRVCLWATGTLAILLLVSWLVAGRIAAPLEQLSARVVLDRPASDVAPSAWASSEVHDIEAALQLGSGQGKTCNPATHINET